MPANFDSSLYAAPQGLEALAADTEPIEIEIIDPEEVNIRAGGMEITIGQDDNGDIPFGANLVEHLDPSVVQTIMSELSSNIDNDLGSRKDWERTYVEGLKLLGLKYEERTEPWTGACGITHPMITEAVVRFQSETITETFPASGPVKTKIIGKETPEKKAASTRVAAEMNYQLTERMPEFRPEHEKLLWNLPSAGCGFKKVYYDPSLGRQTSVFVPAEEIILPYGVADARTSYRVTQQLPKTKNDILKLQYQGFYTDVDIGEPSRQETDIQKAKDNETGFQSQNDDHYLLYEACVELDIPGFEDTDKNGEPTGIMLPYVVTMLAGTNVCLSIRRNWHEDDPLKLKRQHFVQYNYIPGYGPYGMGLFHLIGNFARGSTSILRQLVDAGTLANLPGGLKSRGLRIKGDDTPIAPGEFRDADVGSGVLRDNILPLPYKEPSATLFNLLNSIVEEGRRFAATADMKVSDMSAQAPVGTMLALLERQLKVMTAVQGRVHNSLKQELGLLKDIIRDFTNEDYTYEPDPDTDRPRARRADFSTVEVIPVSDPNASTLAQRVVQYQAALQLAQGAPQLYDLPYLHRGMLEVLGIKNVEKILPLPEDMKPIDPVSENMNVLKGKPVKAFIHQEHEAHLAVHMAMLNDPLMAQTLGQNPQAQMISAALHAHIAEHLGFAYRVKIEQRLGMTLPEPGEPVSPQLEQALAPMLAQAAQQVLQGSQAIMAQQQAQQAAQDPVLQLQQMELQLKQAELRLKAQKQAAEAAAKVDELDLRREEVSGRLQLEATKLGANIQEKRAKLSADQEREGMKMGIDIAKSKQPKGG
jgi:hypothetical protein